MNKRLIKNTTFSILVSALLLSCSSSRHYERDNTDADGLYRTSSADSTNMANEAWQNVFNDPILDSLIAEGLQNNFDLQSAVQQVIAAEASFSQSKAELLPSLSGNINHSYVRTSDSNFLGQGMEYHTFEANLQSSWEIDFWGKLGSAKRAAYANMLSTEAARKAVQTRLISDIASAYYSLISLDEKLKITQETVDTNIKLVETMKILKQSGQVTGAAIVQSEAARYAAEVTLPDLKQQIQATENTLCLLLGRTPGKVDRASLSDQHAHELLSIGVPAELLDNRPDVMQAEYNLISAYEMTNNARTFFYPSVTISASGGLSALEFSDLFDPSSFAANVASGLTQPIFNRRANKTRLKTAKAQKEQALLAFKSALLNAGKEVNDALTDYDASAEKITLRKKQIVALEKSVEYTQELLTYGSATYTEVLNAQQSYLAAQLNSVDDHIQQLNAVVTLYRALGGGWK